MGIFIEEKNIINAGLMSKKDVVSPLISKAVALMSDNLRSVLFQKIGSYYGDGLVVFFEMRRLVDPDQANAFLEEISRYAYESLGEEVFPYLYGSPSYESVKESVVRVWEA